MINIKIKNMFNKKLISILLKILGWVTIIGSIIFIVSGFFTVPSDVDSAAEAAGYVVGYDITGLAVASFFYALLGVLYRLNNPQDK
jgi:hypothetical protein